MDRVIVLLAAFILTLAISLCRITVNCSYGEKCPIYGVIEDIKIVTGQDTCQICICGNCNRSFIVGQDNLTGLTVTACWDGNTSIFNVTSPFFTINTSGCTLQITYKEPAEVCPGGVISTLDWIEPAEGKIKAIYGDEYSSISSLRNWIYTCCLTTSCVLVKDGKIYCVPDGYVETVEVGNTSSQPVSPEYVGVVGVVCRRGLWFPLKTEVTEPDICGDAYCSPNETECYVDCCRKDCSYGDSGIIRKGCLEYCKQSVFSSWWISKEEVLDLCDGRKVGETVCYKDIGLIQCPSSGTLCRAMLELGDVPVFPDTTTFIGMFLYPRMIDIVPILQNISTDSLGKCMCEDSVCKCVPGKFAEELEEYCNLVFCRDGVGLNWKLVFSLINGEPVTIDKYYREAVQEYFTVIPYYVSAAAAQLEWKNITGLGYDAENYTTWIIPDFKEYKYYSLWSNGNPPGEDLIAAAFDAYKKNYYTTLIALQVIYNDLQYYTLADMSSFEEEVKAFMER